jgi:hypothetical protein
MADTISFTPRDGRLPSPSAGARPAPQRRPRARAALAAAAELALALVLAATCFAVVLLVLARAFPQATGIDELLQAEGASWEGAQAPAAHEGASAGTDGGWAVALLTVLDNQVLRKGSGSLAWDPAHDGTKIARGDGVQTTREGMAVVTLDRDDWLRIGRNSLVMLPQPDAWDSGTRNAILDVVGGEVWGEFSGRKGSVRLTVVGARTPVRIESQPGEAAPSRFKLAVRPDHTAYLAVYAGHVTLTAGGRSVTLRANEGVALRAGELTGPVRALPPPPLVSDPDDGRAWRFREFPPAIAFRWPHDPAAPRHRLAIAKDDAFRAVVFEESIGADTLSLGSLGPGAYWWRLSTQQDGFDGPPSAARRMALELDDVPPPLEVAFPADPVADETCRIAGTTEPQGRVFVAGTEVATDADGHFATDTPLHPGSNLVVVEALDQAGNSTYRSRVVRCAPRHGTVR